MAILSGGEVTDIPDLEKREAPLGNEKSFNKLRALSHEGPMDRDTEQRVSADQSKKELKEMMGRLTRNTDKQ